MLLVDDEAPHVLDIGAGHRVLPSEGGNQLDVLSKELDGQVPELLGHLDALQDVILQGRLPLVEGLEKRH